MKRRQCLTLLGGGLLAGGALRATAAFPEGLGHWTIGTPMPSARTEVAVAEVGGKINLRYGGRPLEPRRRHSTRAASRGGGRLAGQALRRRWLC